MGVSAEQLRNYGIYKVDVAAAAVKWADRLKSAGVFLWNIAQPLHQVVIPLSIAAPLGGAIALATFIAKLENAAVAAQILSKLISLDNKFYQHNRDGIADRWEKIGVNVVAYKEDWRNTIHFARKQYHEKSKMGVMGHPINLFSIGFDLYRSVEKRMNGTLSVSRTVHATTIFRYAKLEFLKITADEVFVEFDEENPLPEYHAPPTYFLDLLTTLMGRTLMGYEDNNDDEAICPADVLAMSEEEGIASIAMLLKRKQ